MPRRGGSKPERPGYRACSVWGCHALHFAVAFCLWRCTIRGMGRNDRSTMGFQVDEDMRRLVERLATKEGMTTTGLLKVSVLWWGICSGDAEAFKLVGRDSFRLVSGAIRRKLMRVGEDPS